MKTTEQEAYNPGWLTCTKCGLTAPDVAVFAGKTECKDPTRCAKVLAGEPLGGPVVKGRES